MFKGCDSSVEVNIKCLINGWSLL